MNFVKKYKILIADDSSTFREAFRHTLETFLVGRIAYIVEATNGKDAIEQIGKIDFDVIFMDVKMPVMDGEEATKLIDMQGRRLNIIALSLHKEFATVKRMIEAGARTYIYKEDINEDKIKQIFATLV
jgi:DNA-binding NarL/FixJ family response regulator